MIVKRAVYGTLAASFVWCVSDVEQNFDIAGYNFNRWVAVLAWRMVYPSESNPRYA